MVKTSEQVGKEIAEQTLRELASPSKPLQKTRVWKDPKGYQYLAIWQNAAILRILVRKFTLTLPFNEIRLKKQMDDAARSVKRNIEEGWKRPTTSQYLEYLGFSQASLEEVKGDCRDAKEDGFLKSKPGSALIDIGIDLRVLKGPGKGNAKGEPTDPGHPYHKPLSTLNTHTLTYEIFIELINKTDYLLRTTVSSLERKLSQDKKSYEIDKMRIKDKLKVRW